MIARLPRFAVLPAFVLGSLALAGCTSTDASLGLGSAADTRSVASAPTPAAGLGAAASIGPVQFLPVVGAPPETVAALSRALAASAAANGVAIAASDGPAAPLRLKGYLSALPEGSETVVVYVWDVVDPAGNRVSRIQGEARAKGSAGEAWSHVGEATLEAIAERTMGELRQTARAAG